MNMNRTTILAACLVATSLAAGCAQTDVSDRERAPAEAIAKPVRVIVYDFASTHAAVPPDSAIAGLYRQRTTPQTPEEIELGRRLGALVSARLIEELNEEGIAAIAAATGPVPLPGDAVIRGEFVSIDKGSRAKRMLIGFGAGSAELETLVEGYLVTSRGLVPLGSAQIETAGGKMPGMLVPMGAGAAAGNVARSAAVSGASNILQEGGPEGLDAAAKRTAKEIAREIIKAYKERGWL
jgi:NADPH-dependent 2,4-dienoyl-CoA reductase/sulfur reductase-like enzyme